MTVLDVTTREAAADVRATTTDEAAARRLLREQIARLEHRLSCAVVDSMPDGGVDTAVPALRGPRVLTLGELERLRDALATRVAEARAFLEERERRREDARVRLERMLLAPGDHRHVRIEPPRARRERLRRLARAPAGRARRHVHGLVAGQALLGLPVSHLTA